MNIGEKIRFNRKKLNISLNNLATDIGVSKQALSQYELGKRQPSLEVLLKIAHTLNIPLEYLNSDNSSTKQSSQFIDPLDNNNSIPSFAEVFDEMLNIPAKQKLIQIQNSLLTIIEDCGFKVDVTTDYLKDIESVSISVKEEPFTIYKDEYKDLVDDIYASITKCILNAKFKHE